MPIINNLTLGDLYILNILKIQYVLTATFEARVQIFYQEVRYKLNIWIYLKLKWSSIKILTVKMS